MNNTEFSGQNNCSTGDIVRRRMIRQMPRPSSLSTSSVTPPKLKNSEIQGEGARALVVKNRFQYRDKSLSLVKEMKVSNNDSSDFIDVKHDEVDTCESKKVVKSCEAIDSVCEDNEKLCKGCGEFGTIVFKGNIRSCTNCGAFSLSNNVKEFTDFDGCNEHQDSGIQADKTSSPSNDDKHEEPVQCKNNTKRGALLNSSSDNKRAKLKINANACLTISSDEDKSDGENENVSKDRKNNDRDFEVELSVNNDSCISSKPLLHSETSYHAKINACQMKNKIAAVLDEKRSEDMKFAIPISHVKFGTLNGKAISEMVLDDYHLKIDIQCTYPVTVDGVKKQSTEKYKLALGSAEIMEILVNNVDEPLMICIVPKQSYTTLVNGALKKSVLEITSNLVTKRQIIFIVNLEIEKFRGIINHHKKALEKIGIVKMIDNITKNRLLDSFLPEQSGTNQKRTYNTRSRQMSSVISRKHGIAKTLFNYHLTTQKGAIAITDADVECLEPETYLNDTIIDFYLNYIVEEILDDDARDRTYLFNTYFYTTLTKKMSIESKTASCQSDQMYCQVKKWTRNVDIFNKDFVIIPVNEHAHWYLVIICFPGLVEKSWEGGNTIESIDDNEVLNDENMREFSDASMIESCASTKVDQQSLETLASSKKSVCGVSENKRNQPCILIFDSLISGGRSRVFSNLRKYLTNEWKEKKSKNHLEIIFNKDNIKGSFPKIPLQNNDCDCGLYVLQFAESFFQNPITDYKLPIKKLNWFTNEVIKNKRGQIKDILCKLEKDHATQNTKP
eukprot:gene5473-6157_t